MGKFHLQPSKSLQKGENLFEYELILIYVFLQHMGLRPDCSPWTYNIILTQLRLMSIFGAVPSNRKCLSVKKEKEKREMFEVWWNIWLLSRRHSPGCCMGCTVSVRYVAISLSTSTSCDHQNRATQCKVNCFSILNLGMFWKTIILVLGGWVLF